MRVYVPTTLTGLAQAYRDGELELAPLRAYAVTPALREWYLSDDIEELEYAALLRAAQASLRLLAKDEQARRRRVVIVLDVPEQAVAPRVAAEHEVPSALGAVQVIDRLSLRQAAAVHADAAEAEADVAAAARSVAGADAGDDDARFTVDAVEDHELLWYATQEIDGLLR